MKTYIIISICVLGLWIANIYYLYPYYIPPKKQHIADNYIYGNHAYRSIKIVHRGSYIDVTYKRIKKEE